MKKIIPIEENFTETDYQRPKLSVVRDPKKMPIITISRTEATEKPTEKKSFSMPEVPAGYIKCKKHDCL
jgi:hypothetical protein